MVLKLYSMRFNTFSTAVAYLVMYIMLKINNYKFITFVVVFI